MYGPRDLKKIGRRSMLEHKEVWTGCWWRLLGCLGREIVILKVVRQRLPNNRWNEDKHGRVMLQSDISFDFHFEVSVENSADTRQKTDNLLLQLVPQRNEYSDYSHSRETNKRISTKWKISLIIYLRWLFLAENNKNQIIRMKIDDN